MRGFKTWLCMLLFLLLLSAPGAFAEVDVSPVFSDGVVLQRDALVPVWGWANPGEKVQVDFAGKSAQAVADGQGRWQVTLPSMPANAKGGELTIRGEKNTLVVRDVVVGEVWLMIGDHQFLSRFDKMGGTGTAGSNLRVAVACVQSPFSYPVAVPNITTWKSAGIPQILPVFFGEQLQTALKIPVGIIVATSSAVITPFFSIQGMDGIAELDYLRPLTAHADPRTPEGKAAFRQYKEEVVDWLPRARMALAAQEVIPLPPPAPQTDHTEFDKGNNNQWNVGNIYNSLIHPLAPLALRGVVFHSGSYNSMFGANGGYDHRIAFGAKCKAVLQTLRQTWRKPELPVYFLGVPAGDAIFDANRVAQVEALKGEANCEIVSFAQAKNDKNAGAKLLAASVLEKAYGQPAATSVGAAAAPQKELVDPAQGTGFDPAVFSVPARVKSAPQTSALRLPFVFADHMVLQRNAALPVWGWGTPGKTVSVSFAGEKREAPVNEFGKWSLVLPELKANAVGENLVVTEGADSITLRDVLVGDVWLCSGQSNMQMQLLATRDAQAEIAQANYPLIRHMRIDRDFLPMPVEETAKSPLAGEQWQVCTPQSAGSFSAAAYYFAKEITMQTGIPVGLIHSSLGGSRIEPWINPEGYASVPELVKLAEEAKFAGMNNPLYQAKQAQVLRRVDGWLATFDDMVNAGEVPAELPGLVYPARTEIASYNSSKVCQLYNGKIWCIVPYALKGVLWYQGESNGGEGDSYVMKLRALINGWRTVWKQGDLPFYIVQLANFQAPAKMPGQGDGWARLREAQLKSLVIPYTGMAVAIDIGEAGDIHPKNKLDVGKRLARWALHHEYGKKDLTPSGPLFDSFKVEGDAIRVRFRYADQGLIVGEKKGVLPVSESKSGALAEFAIAGADQKWVPARAVIEGDSVLVSAPEVKSPVAVRYAFSMNPAKANLYNREGLPASPFRTDSW